MEMQVARPKVYPWFVAYCILMCVLYLFVTGMGFMYPKLAELAGSSERMATATFFGPLYSIFGLIFFFAYLIALFLKPGPGVWVYDLVLICFGMTSCCCLPITIPLLIFWIKPETKKYFGR
ncbi:MAG: hypothetical protein M0R48_03240 [Candidatus Omnitrophica bacterium]|jgi:cytochrome b subunit of formate dehydrogenase|nr:hypothetical protein [Candidatus Omnitrophota bacterium]